MKRTCLTMVLFLASATPALAGPPWIRAALPADHTLAARFGAVIAVHTFHHGTPAPFALHGTAEGLVNGERRSVPLRFDAGPDSATFLIPRTWGSDGVWVLTVTGTAEHGTPGLLVGLDAAGVPVLAREPRRAGGESRPASAGEVEAMLRHLEGGSPPPALRDARWRILLTRRGAPGLAVLALPILLVVAVAGRMRRRHIARQADTELSEVQAQSL